MPTDFNSAQDTDFLVVGAGIAGASIAYWLAPHGRVVVLERESQPGYHTTGRSAALYMATYGTPNIQALTRASRAFYDAPPPEFGADPILSPRGVVYVAGPDQLDLLKQTYEEAHAASPNVQWVDKAELLANVGDDFKNGITQSDKTDWSKLKDLEGKKVGTITARSSHVRTITKLMRISSTRPVCPSITTMSPSCTSASGPPTAR